MNREDFNVLNTGVIYFDNGATTLKPLILSEAVSDYYNNYSSNAHRGDYDIAHSVDKRVAETRKRCAEFINANENEIVFTSGATMSINTIAYGFASKILKNNLHLLKYYGIIQNADLKCNSLKKEVKYRDESRNTSRL